MLPRGVTLYFVRHGETDWNLVQRYQGQTDVPLNATGRAQAARNGRILRDLVGTRAQSFDFIASPLERASETMRIIRREMGLAPDDFRQDERLKEQHYGHWEGELWSELPRIDPEGFAARKADKWGWVPRGGESYAMLTIRIAGWLDEIGRDTVVVSHGAVSRALRGIVLGLPQSEIPQLEAPQDKVLALRDGAAEWL